MKYSLCFLYFFSESEKVKYLFNIQVTNTAQIKDIKRAGVMFVFNISTKYNKIEASAIKPTLPTIPKVRKLLNCLEPSVQNQVYVDVQ